MDVCSIVLADDHVMFRQGVKRIIEETPGLEVVGEANDGLELLSLLKAQAPGTGHPGHLHAPPPGPGSHPGDQKALSPGQGHIPDHAPVQGVPPAGPGGRGRWLSLERGRRLRALAGHPDGQGGEKIHLNPPVHRDGGSGLAGPGGRPRSPVPSGKRPSSSSWWKARLPRKLRTCCISASSRCAGTGTTSCGNST